MNIIITGASRGIGYELVKLFSADKQHSVIAVSRNADNLKKLKKECEKLNSLAKVITLPCDLSNDEEIKKMTVLVKKHFDKIDVLINNAGALVNKPFGEITSSDLEYVYKVNVFAVFKLMQSLLPLMNTKNRAHVVNIGSVGGVQGSLKFPGLSAYSSSKAALASLTECLAEEFKSENIAFNCLALGAVQTEMLGEAFPGYQAPLTASEMAKYIAQFALTAQQYINGKIIPVSMSNP